MIRIGIIGGAGYTAGELIRLLLAHPQARIAFVHSTSTAGPSPKALGRTATRRPRSASVSVNLFFTSFAKYARRSRKGGFTGCANVFSPIPVTA